MYKNNGNFEYLVAVLNWGGGMHQGKSMQVQMIEAGYLLDIRKGYFTLYC